MMLNVEAAMRKARESDDPVLGGITYQYEVASEEPGHPEASETAIQAIHHFANYCDDHDWLNDPDAQDALAEMDRQDPDGANYP